MTSGNSDGKGRTGVLEDLAACAPQGEYDVDDRIVAGTMLVLSAEMNFLPIKGKQYYLYERGRLYLAVISPQEAIGDLGTYIGSCTQRQDCFWDVDLEQLPSSGLPFNAGILHGKFFDERFGYYNRILSFHVAKRVKLLPPGTLRLLGSGSREP